MKILYRLSVTCGVYSVNESQWKGSESPERSHTDSHAIADIKIKRPPLYKVILHNDDYTTMEFVVYILKTVFSKNEEDAQFLMLKIHREGLAICGIFTKEIAETKVARVLRLAKNEKSPLLCTMERE